MFVWKLLALPALLAGIVALAACGVVLVVGFRRANQRLAFLFLAEAATMFAGAAATLSGDVPTATRVANFVAIFYVTLPLAYLTFLGIVDSPLSKPFRTPAMPYVVGAIALGLIALVLASPTVFVPGVHEGSHGAWEWDEDTSAFAKAVFPPMILVPIFGLIVAISAWRRAPAETLAKRKAKHYAIAFGLRDAIGAVVIFFGVVMRIARPESEDWWVWAILYPAGSLLTVVLLGYAILKTQLFDIDLRLKLGVARGTVVALVVCAALVASKVAEAYASKAWGYVLGAVIAGLTVFVGPRLNRMADNVANKAAPKVRATSEYMSYRKLEVYRAAVESAIEVGGIEGKERELLLHLRRKLGLSEADAEAVEADVLDVRERVRAAPPVSA